MEMMQIQQVWITLTHYLQIDGSLFIMVIMLILKSKFSMVNLMPLLIQFNFLFKIQCSWFLNNYQFFQEKMNGLCLGKVNSKVGILLLETDIIQKMDLKHYLMLQQNVHSPPSQYRLCHNYMNHKETVLFFIQNAIIKEIPIHSAKLHMKQAT